MSQAANCPANPQTQWCKAAFVPGYSGGTATDFHRFPYSSPAATSHRRHPGQTPILSARFVKSISRKIMEGRRGGRLLVNSYGFVIIVTPLVTELMTATRMRADPACSIINSKSLIIKVFNNQPVKILTWHKISSWPAYAAGHSSANRKCNRERIAVRLKAYAFGGLIELNPSRPDRRQCFFLLLKSSFGRRQAICRDGQGPTTSNARQAAMWLGTCFIARPGSTAVRIGTRRWIRSAGNRVADYTGRTPPAGRGPEWFPGIWRR